MNLAKNIALDQRKITKALNTLMGLVNGIVCDGVLQEIEIQFLSTWMKENSEIAGVYPANIVYRRVKEVLQDGVITEEEKEHLFKELSNLSGNDFSNTGSALPEYISSVFDDDPHVIFEGNSFVLTGIFLYGTRNACFQAIEKRGGTPKETITTETNYLVVGASASPDWIVANFGRKIQKAAEMVKSGEYEISIIREVDLVMAFK